MSPPRMATVKKETTTSVDADVKEPRTFKSCWWEVPQNVKLTI
jgi:hypothetical protein